MKENIQNKIDAKKDIFNLFWNRIHSISSPNINLENIIFEEANKFIYLKYKDQIELDIILKQDLKSLIATKNSLIQRPSFLRPSKLGNNIEVDFTEVGEYVRIAKFEHELVVNDFGENRQQHIVFEGITPLEKENPFFEYLPSSLIWLDAFYYGTERRIIGFCKKFNSIESKYLIWIDSIKLEHLGLILDNYNNGLRALNNRGEVVLKFGYWKENFLNNSASFTNLDNNIAKLEGCELLLRRDYLNLLKALIPNLKYVVMKL